MKQYKIVINRDNEDQWTNWSGTDRAIIEAIIDDLTAELGVIRTSELDVIRTSEELIDYTDNNGVVIADFCEEIKKEQGKKPLFPDDELPLIGFRGNKKIIINNGEYQWQVKQ